MSDSNLSEEKVNKQFKGIVFDLDGTLLNTITDINNALNFALTSNGLKEVTIDETKMFIGSGAITLIERTLKYVLNIDVKDINKKLFDNVYNMYMERYKSTSTKHTNPYDGIIKTLKILKRKGIKLAVLSNKPQRDTDIVCKKYFSGLFDIVFGGREGVALKPNPNCLFETIKLLGLKNDEVIYVGDSDVDVKTAINANVFGSFVCYGYKTKKELVEAGAQEFINTPNDLLKYFTLEINGVLLIDKPYKMTSQDAVIAVKRRLQLTKVGHAGTLDPLATGLLVVLLGDATKISQYLLEEEKGYIAEVTIGFTTNTWDLEGTITETQKVNKELTEKMIDECLQSLVGDITLDVPMHSAIKVDGKKLYDLAHSGKSVEIPPRDYKIIDIFRNSDVIYENDTAKFTFICHVSKGTYIRSLCKEIGSRLNFPSVMTSLRRISSGRLNISDANSLYDITKDNYKIIDMIDAVKKQNIVEIRPTLIHRIVNGREVYLPNKEKLLFMTYQGKLVGIYELQENGSYKAIRVWR